MKFLFSKPLVDVIRDEGIEVNHRGLFLCPFHEDRNPSAHVYADGHFHCFGCGAHGDAIDFIQKHRSLSFKQACSYLGVGFNGRLTPREATEVKVKRELIGAFRDWMRDYYDELATLYRATHKVMAGVKTIEEVERLAPAYQELPIIEYRMELLIRGSEEEKFNLFREVWGG